MKIILSCIGLTAGGFLLYIVTMMIPLLQLVYMDFIALFLLVAPTIILLYMIINKRLIWFMEKVPNNKMLIFFLRRDQDIVPVLGHRTYPGESFITVAKVGLLHDLGEDSVYRLAGNNVRFALENVNHTPKLKFANFTNWLHNLGINNIEELQDSIKGKNEAKVKDIEEKIPMFSVEPAEELHDIIAKKMDDIE